MASTSGATVAARVTLDRAPAERAFAALSEGLDPAQTACALFETAPGRWTVTVHFSDSATAGAIRSLIADAAGAEAAAALAFETVAETDWVAASFAGLAPVAAGRFVVHGAHDRDRVPANAIGIEIEAALAFGTGHHGTTRGCLLALDRLGKTRHAQPSPPPAKGRSLRETRRVGVNGLMTPPRIAFGNPTLPFQGRVRERLRILDLGTGTGVLAIAAARMLREPVLASDIDARAVTIARANARCNRAGAFVEVVCATGLGHRRFRQRQPFDLVLANILLGPLQRLARPIAGMLAPRARVILSGLLPEHANAALSAYRLQGLALERRIVEDNWVTLVLRRGA